MEYIGDVSKFPKPSLQYTEENSLLVFCHLKLCCVIFAYSPLVSVRMHVFYVVAVILYGYALFYTILHKGLEPP